MIGASEHPFSPVAASYDAAFTRLSVVEGLRSMIHAELLKRLPPAGNILDIGCGTGEDAAFLSGQGFHVVGIDPSPGMLACARAKNQTTFGGPYFLRMDAYGITAFRDASFHGILANFGSLNCVGQLMPVLQEAARILKPRGTALLCFLNRHSLWETGAYLIRARPQAAFRRWREGPVEVPVGTRTIPTWYHSLGDIRRSARPWFNVEFTAALNVVAPPPSSQEFVRRHPHIARALVGLEAAIREWPVVSQLGDHTLVILRRREGGPR